MENPAQFWLEINSLFGAGARNWRFTLSRGHGSAGSDLVVFWGLPRTTPLSPAAFISLATVQRATLKPSRRSCRQTLRTP